MGGNHPETKAACRYGLHPPCVGFRAGISNVYRHVKRIFCSQAPSKPSIRAGSTLPSKERLRPLSLVEEENFVARQVREIYGKLQTGAPHRALPIEHSASSSCHSYAPWCPITYPSRSQRDTSPRLLSEAASSVEQGFPGRRYSACDVHYRPFRISGRPTTRYCTYNQENKSGRSH